MNAQDSPPEGLSRGDRLTILTGLAGITLLSWAYLVVTARQMGQMSMGDMADVVAVRTWSGTNFGLMFLMWAVMMVGMMVPTAVPMTLLYASAARRAASRQSPLAPTAIFVGGYIVMWSLFSVGATLAQWALDQAALLSPMMVSSSPMLGAGLLIVAGVYQWTPFKGACLKHCRAPVHFFTRNWRRGAWGAFRMGLSHGAYCLGCCWILMGLLFLGGVMNLLWIGVIALFVLLEKVVPFGDRGGRFAGAAMIVLGVLSLAGFGFGLV